MSQPWDIFTLPPTTFFKDVVSLSHSAPPPAHPHTGDQHPINHHSRGSYAFMSPTPIQFELYLKPHLFSFSCHTFSFVPIPFGYYSLVYNVPGSLVGRPGDNTTTCTAVCGKVNNRVTENYHFWLWKTWCLLILMNTCWLHRDLWPEESSWQLTANFVLHVHNCSWKIPLWQMSSETDGI